jgi:hypothetical protein
MRLVSGARRRREAVGAEDTFVGRAHLVCAECRHAQLFAVQPRAVCTCRGAALEGCLVFSGRPACDDVEPCRGDERTLAWCTLRAATANLRFARVRPHLF